MKFLKYLLYLILFLFIAGFIAVKVMSEKKPEGKSGAEADALAESMLKTIDKNAFDTIPFLQWEFFRPGQKYLWDKVNNKAIIEYDDIKVYMNLNTLNAQAFQNDILLEGDAHEKAKQKAWSNWCNDSFWMLAPFKIFDKGTSRKVVDVEDKKALLIEYNSGGVTPGDAYLWLLDDNNRPTGWKMWTSIIPIKGIYNAWSGWETHLGAQFSTEHDFFGKVVTMKNVKAGKSWNDFGYDKDPMAGI
ncbi:MAG: hypothetical protein HKO66_15880 [Saprospiraceae bacterium]|nr:hypothetical protein [Bacteroidia bacterium]NNE16701.1 hypothetical protein [Saprospiraceae bacterium]NNL93722.1 hypothetical protein [Saprospiraceae bacterium]